MTSILTADGLSLEARWDDAEGQATAAAVVCHPHPLDGGTMNAPLLGTVVRSLTGTGVHVLRFNFRGVGRSEGSWGEGRGETIDVAAAVEAATLAFPDLPLGITGWSFGATTSLRWQAECGSTISWAGIAPGIRSYRGAEMPDLNELSPAKRLIVTGDRDRFATIEQMSAFASDIGAQLKVITGADHFFVFRHEEVAALVAEHLAPPTPPQRSD